MNFNYRDETDYEQYEALFDPQRTDRQARRSRKPKVKHMPKKAEQEVIRELADVGVLEGESSFKTTYIPSRYEAEWLLKALHDFYRNEFITDVLAQVRGGKEASVYRCAARPAHGVEFLAAKVYRPRKFRQLRNDKMYREGRAVLTAGGEEIKENEQRVMRALGKKTAFGVQVEQTSWLMYEFTTLQTLHAAGAAVPKPFAVHENAILMQYIGDADRAAPTLSTVELDRDEARTLFAKTVKNIELMLTHHMIHGDLSAYNILYWEGDITLIDFPQVTNSQGNSQAYFILQRDIERVCAYFEDQGVQAAADPERILNRLWKQYVEGNPHERAADLSRLLEKPEEEEYEE